MTRAFTDNDIPKAKDIFIRSSINLLVASVGIAVILCCNLQNIVAVVGNGKNYSGIIPVFIIILIGQLVNFATGMNDQVLSITNYYKFNFYLSISLIAIMFVLIKFLVPAYGIYGAAAANAIVFIIFNTVKCLYVWKKIDFQPFSKNTLLIIVCGIPALAGGYFFPYLFEPARHVYIHTFVDAAMRSSVVAIIYLAMLLWLKPSQDLQDYIASIKKNKRLF
jgi:O-antigen/teichoic acid export membrane protein